VIPATFVGMALALGSLITMMLLEGTNPLAVVLLPPLVLVFGATFGAAAAGSTMADLRKLGAWFRLSFGPERTAVTGSLIAQLVELATMARKEGMLPLENRARSVEDPFLRRGLQLAIDAVPVEQLRRVLEREIEATRADDLLAARFFAKMGGYAPTIGIIGTVIGLIHVLADLGDTAALGPLIATAFVATLWGVLSANFLWLPMSHRIMRTSDLRTAQLELLLTGIAEIQAGTSPRAMRQRLTSLLPPAEATSARAAA
jgi:chemotaxis protein MotA